MRSSKHKYSKPKKRKGRMPPEVTVQASDSTLWAESILAAVPDIDPEGVEKQLGECREIHEQHVKIAMRLRQAILSQTVVSLSKLMKIGLTVRAGQSVVIVGTPLGDVLLYFGLVVERPPQTAKELAIIIERNAKLQAEAEADVDDIDEGWDTDDEDYEENEEPVSPSLAGPLSSANYFPTVHLTISGVFKSSPTAPVSDIFWEEDWCCDYAFGLRGQTSWQEFETAAAVGQLWPKGLVRTWRELAEFLVRIVQFCLANGLLPRKDSSPSSVASNEDRPLGYVYRFSCEACGEVFDRFLSERRPLSDALLCAEASRLNDFALSVGIGTRHGLTQPPPVEIPADELALVKCPCCERVCANYSCVAVSADSSSK